MPLPKNINFDRVIADILGDMKFVANGWSHGAANDETALLNRITERLMRRRRRCDVGVSTPMVVEADYFELHRAGTNQTDKYGADFAVTICIPTEDYKKTAFFQLKKSSGYVVTLTKEQLDDALLVPSIAPRSFVLSVDEERLGYRVKAVKDCRGEIMNDRDSKQFETEEWDFLVVWLLKWFRCTVGLPSKPEDPNPVEDLLDEFRIHPRIAGLDFDEQNIPDGFVPAKWWLSYTIAPTDTHQ